MHKVFSSFLLAAAVLSSVATSGGSGGASVTSGGSQVLWPSMSMCEVYVVGVHADDVVGTSGGELHIEATTAGANADTATLFAFGPNNDVQRDLSGNDSASGTLNNVFDGCQTDLGYCTNEIELCVASDAGNASELDANVTVTLSARGDGFDPRLILETL